MHNRNAFLDLDGSSRHSKKKRGVAQSPAVGPRSAPVTPPLTRPLLPSYQPSASNCRYASHACRPFDGLRAAVWGATEASPQGLSSLGGFVGATARALRQTPVGFTSNEVFSHEAVSDVEDLLETSPGTF